jgi:hypothetical protein
MSRQLQTELKRVGCYDGDVNGVWTRESRQAMSAFIDRANATLPVDELSPILGDGLMDQAAAVWA